MLAALRAQGIEADPRTRDIKFTKAERVMLKNRQIADLRELRKAPALNDLPPDASNEEVVAAINSINALLRGQYGLEGSTVAEQLDPQEEAKRQAERDRFGQQAPAHEGPNLGQAWLDDVNTRQGDEKPFSLGVPEDPDETTTKEEDRPKSGAEAAGLLTDDLDEGEAQQKAVKEGATIEQANPPAPLANDLDDFDQWLKGESQKTEEQQKATEKNNPNEAEEQQG
jgi:hypothetical protein